MSFKPSLKPGINRHSADHQDDVTSCRYILPDRTRSRPFRAPDLSWSLTHHTRHESAFYAHAPSTHTVWAMEAGVGPIPQRLFFTKHSLRNPQPNFYMHATLIWCLNSCALPGSSW